MIDESLIVVKGVKRTIAYAVARDGTSPAKVFLARLSKGDAAKLKALFDRMASIGYISNEEQFRKERGEIWGFKRHQIRVGCFQEGATWFLTHGFIKKKNKWPESELVRAERIRDEHLARASE